MLQSYCKQAKSSLLIMRLPFSLLRKRYHWTRDRWWFARRWCCDLSIRWRRADIRGVVCCKVTQTKRQRVRVWSRDCSSSEVVAGLGEAVLLQLHGQLCGWHGREIRTGFHVAASQQPRGWLSSCDVTGSYGCG